MAPKAEKKPAAKKVATPKAEGDKKKKKGSASKSETYKVRRLRAAACGRRAAGGGLRAAGCGRRQHADGELTLPPHAQIYIYKVLKQVHPDTGISSKAMSILNSFINDIFEKARLRLQARSTAEGSQPTPRTRADCHGDGHAGALQQKAHGHLAGDPDRREAHPAWRARQARRLRGHQGGDQVHQRLKLCLVL